MEGGPSIQERDSAQFSSSENLLTNEENVKGCGNLFCHPRGKMHRFVALIFMCFLGFGSYFCFDNPAALQNYLEDDLGLTVSEYTMLYSIYSWPNVIMCFLGGFLCDRYFGIRLGTNIYMGLTLVGQLIFAWGVYMNLYWLMIVGRFVFGIGAESLAVTQNNYAVLWFKGKELNMVFGLQLSFARLGSSVNFLIMEKIYDWVSEAYSGAHALGIILFIATSTCVLSMVCALILGVFDKRAERILNRNANTSTDIVRLQDVKDFRATFWIVTVICVAYYVAIFPFITIAKSFFIDEFHMSDEAANQISGIVYLISAGASPVLGLLIDKAGKNVTWILVATACTILAHCLLAFTHVEPYVAMSIMGLAYSTLASSLWPLVSLLIPDYQLGTAYGVCQSVQNLGLAIAPLITGPIVDNYGYLQVEIFFIGSLVVALASTALLYVLDKSDTGVLNMTPGDRLIHLGLTVPLTDDDKSVEPSSDPALPISEPEHI